MNPNAKTPVMVLQELTVKKGLPSPEYSIILARQGTHENEFHYQVNTAGITAIGFGRSKQIAKHDAAIKALDIMAEKGLYKPDETPIHTPRSETGVNSPIQQLLTVNSIKSLNEICMENKLPFPEFLQISDVGPPHCKEFTYDCIMASIKTRATAGTKKHAKQLAAKEMLERIMQVLPDLVAECSEDPINRPALTDQDAAALENYIQLKEFKRPKPNLALKVEEYDQNINNIMKEHNINFDDLAPYFNGEKSEETLKELLEKLQLNYVFEIVNQNPIILTLSLNTDVPFTVMVQSDTMDLAKQDAVLQAFEYLEIFAK